MDEPRLTAAVAAALKPSGLRPRGWLGADPDTAPRLADGTPAVAICLVGHAGGGFWPVFEAWQETHPGIPDPLDTWSKAVIRPIAASLGGEAVFPSDQPWQPFQQWAMAAEGLRPSPLGLLCHPEYGLWHGYRGAILFGAGVLADQPAHGDTPVSEMAEGIAEPAIPYSRRSLHPCDSCSDKPCLDACPVDAFDGAGFDVAGCRTYLKTEAGARGCMQSGCLARNACPVGRTYRYGGAQLRFHMVAFG